MRNVSPVEDVDNAYSFIFVDMDWGSRFEDKGYKKKTQEN